MIRYKAPTTNVSGEENYLHIDIISLSLSLGICMSQIIQTQQRHGHCMSELWDETKLAVATKTPEHTLALSHPTPLKPTR